MIKGMNRAKAMRLTKAWSKAHPKKARHYKRVITSMVRDITKFANRTARHKRSR